MGSSDVLRVFDIADQDGTTRYVGVRPQAGHTIDLSAALHRAASGSWQGAAGRASQSGRVGATTPAFVQVTAPAGPSFNFDAIVLQNNNGGSGSFTIYADTQKPTGSVTINSGAQYTNSPTVSLSLSATNPTAG